MNEMADSSDGVNSGSSASATNRGLNGNAVRVIAYAYPKASGITKAVVSTDTQTLFHRDCTSAGVEKYVR